MYKFTKLILPSLILALFLCDLNISAGKPALYSGYIAGNNSSNLVVIKGKIKSIDLFKMEIILEGCALLGNKPLRLSEKTDYYLGTEDDSIDSIRGGLAFSENNKINFYDLEVGHTIKCNYEIIDGNFWALRVIRVSSDAQHIMYNYDFY